MTKGLDGVNNSIAGAAVASPIWLPWLSSMSEVSALLLPIAGLAWLVIQIVGYLVKKEKKERNNNVPE